MIFERLHGVQIPKIGLGTYRIGGEAAPDPAVEEKSRAALRSALELGYTHFDTAEYYAGGHAEELIGITLHEMGVKREEVFITTKISPEHLRPAEVRSACECSLKRLQSDFIDLYLIHWPNAAIPLEETFTALNQLVSEGKIHHVGVSNFNLKELQKAKALCATPLLTNQVPYSLPQKKYVHNGVVEYCQRNDILITAYTPVKFRNLPVNPTLAQIAAAHQATPHQIALTWLTAQPRVITIPFSTDRRHQEENLAAVEIQFRDDEMAQLNGLYPD